MSNIIYTWDFPGKKERGALWYTIVFSILVGLVVWGFLSKMYIMSFVFLLLAGLTYFVENNSEDTVKVDITELGIKVGTGFYDFSNIVSYTMIYEGENAVILRLNLNKKGLKNIDLLIDNNVAIELINILPNFIEVNSKETLNFTDKMIRLLKL